MGKLYLTDVNNNCYGEIGKATQFCDEVGRQLHVGDIVEYYLFGEVKKMDIIVSKDGNDFIYGCEEMFYDNTHYDKNHIRFMFKKASYKALDTDYSELNDGLFVRER